MNKKAPACDLTSCFLCQHTLPEWRPAIEANRKSLHFKKGQLLFSEGEKVEGIYFITSGKVKVHKKWGTEKELIVRFAQTGDIVGHRGLGHESYYPISATALEPVNACYIDLPFYEATLKVNYDFIYRLLRFFADELQDSEKNMRNLAHMQVKGRIAHALLALKDKFGITGEGLIDIDLSRQDLASFAGTTYETVFRIINEFAQENIIGINGKRISILEEGRLKDLTKEREN